MKASQETTQGARIRPAKNAKRADAVKAAVQLAVLLLALIAASPRPAQAYVDPGSGALIWQVLVAGFVGVVFSVRKFIFRLRPRARGPEDLQH